jgi:hypothetical protein
MSLPPLSSQVFNGLGQTSGQAAGQPARAGQAAFFRAALGAAATAAPAPATAALSTSAASPALARPATPAGPEPLDPAAPLRRPGTLLDIVV